MSKKATKAALKTIKSISELISKEKPDYGNVETEITNLKGIVPSICGDDWLEVNEKIETLIKTIKEKQRPKKYIQQLAKVKLKWLKDNARVSRCKKSGDGFQENKIKF